MVSEVFTTRNGEEITSRILDHLTSLIREYFLFGDKLKSLYGWSFVAWATVIGLNPYRFADLHEVYTDHMRHEYVSWAYL